MNFPQLPQMGTVKTVHFVGIGGCGMSAIAKILFGLGYQIAGSDLKESANTIRLKDLGIKIYYEHNPANVRSADILVVSSAIPANNPEVEEAKSRQIPVFPRAAMLGWLFRQAQFPIGIAGTHGKTTTTSMVATILEKCNCNPTYLIGGEMNDVNGNAFLGKGQYLVAEMDESDGSLVYLNPRYFLLTNVEADHLEHFGSLEEIIKFFLKCINCLPPDGALIVNSDHASNKKIMKEIKESLPVVTYGFGEEAQARGVNIRLKENMSWFQCIYQGKLLGELELIIPGNHNVANALGALAVGLKLGLDFGKMRLALRNFTGSRRRFQLIGETEDILIYDDYAHHPTEVAATLAAVRNGWPRRRILAVFQPHRYTRTMFLHRDFGEAFENADVIVLTDIYSAGEASIKGVSSRLIAEQIRKKTDKKVAYIPRKEKVPEYLMNLAKSGDIIVFMGAGDIYTVAKEIFYRLTSLKKEEKIKLPLV